MMNLPNTYEIIEALTALASKEKFVEEDFYPGAPSEEIQESCQRRVNDFISDVKVLLQQDVKIEALFGRARSLIQEFEEEDTEEREKVGDYIGDVMRILGVDDWVEHL